LLNDGEVNAITPSALRNVFEEGEANGLEQPLDVIGILICEARPNLAANHLR
jgi:hypothetical protein